MSGTVGLRHRWLTIVQLLRQIAETRKQWQAATFAGTYTDAKLQSMQFADYKKTMKRAWVAEKAELMSLLGNIKTKLGTYGLKDYVPPQHLSLANLDRVWTELMQAENKRSMQINQTIREYVSRARGLRR